DGDALKQKDALWHYLALGKDAPSPKPAPPLAVPVPASGPLVAQIPVRPPGAAAIESMALLTRDGDLVIYDLGIGAVQSVFVGARLLRGVQGRIRTFSAEGTAVEFPGATGDPLQMASGKDPEAPASRTFLGYDRQVDGVRLRWRVRFAAGE